MNKKRLIECLSVIFFTLILLCLGCGEDSSASAYPTPEADGRGGGENYYHGDSDGDSDGDADGDSDGDGDDDEGDPYVPPEVERQANYKVPQGAGKHVFIPDEGQDAVEIVDSEDLSVEVVEVGSRPTHLVTLSETGTTAVAVINHDRGPYNAGLAGVELAVWQR